MESNETETVNPVATSDKNSETVATSDNDSDSEAENADEIAMEQSSHEANGENLGENTDINETQSTGSNATESTDGNISNPDDVEAGEEAADPTSTPSPEPGTRITTLPLVIFSETKLDIFVPIFSVVYHFYPSRLASNHPEKGTTFR